MQQMQGNHEVALSLFEKVLGLRPDNALAYSNLALLQRGAAARASLDAAIGLHPAGPLAPDLWLRSGLMHLRLGQLGLAQHALRRSLELQPGSAVGQALAAETYALRHDYTRAARRAAEASRLQADSRLPRCAYWHALAPRLGGPWVDERARTGYSELLVGCAADHAKVGGGGWHRVERVASAGEAWRLTDRFDEVHWCDAAAPEPPFWPTVRGLLRAKGLLAMQVPLSAPELDEARAQAFALLEDPGDGDDTPEPVPAPAASGGGGPPVSLRLQALELQRRPFQQGDKTEL